jgi:hypothetical protein
VQGQREAHFVGADLCVGPLKGSTYQL